MDNELLPDRISSSGTRRTYEAEQEKERME